MRIYIIFFLIAIFFGGCAIDETNKKDMQKSDEVKTEEIVPKLEYFVNKHNVENTIFQNISKFKKQFKRKYFRPWDIKDFSYEKRFSIWGINAIKKRKFYGENKKLIDSKLINEIVKNSNFDNFNSSKKRAITIKNSSLRTLPSSKPFFKKSTNYPFDYSQNSSIKANQPLFISHFSLDKAWIFVESAFAIGWISLNDIAYVDENFVQNFTDKELLIVTKEKTAIYNSWDNFLFYAKMGSIFPLIETHKDYYEVFQTNKDEMFNGKLNIIKISKKQAQIHPLEFNKKELNSVLNELLDEKYGWGGMYQNRDCSSMVRDFFIAFGVWLPRNSAVQSRYLKYVDISKLPPKEKEQKIIEIAVPFETILYLKGHIMLYLGEFENQAFVMHNTWGGGVKFKDSKKKIIYGKTLISSLYLGSHLEKVDTSELLIHKVIGISQLIPHFILNK